MSDTQLDALRILNRLIDLDEKKPTNNPEARGIVEDARIVCRRPRRELPEVPLKRNESDNE